MATPAQGNSKNATNQQAYDEAMRELNVRERCYGRWVADGKMSRTEARERLDRMARVCELLAGLPDVTVNTTSDVDSGVAPF